MSGFGDDSSAEHTPDGTPQAQVRLRGRSRWRISSAGAIALVAVGITIAIAIGIFAPKNRELVPIEGAVGATQSARSPLAEEVRIVVHVTGAVERAGVIELSSGSRVADALVLAGGTTSDADLTPINLARILVDGEQLVVPTASQVAAAAAAGVPLGAASGGGSATTGIGAGGGAASGEVRVSLNTADATALDTLPGVGPALAQRIIDYRTKNGGFRAIEELLDVSGIGDATFEKIEPLVTL